MSLGLNRAMYLALTAHLDLTLSTAGTQPPTIVQFGANSPLELSRAASLVIPYVGGVDLNCGCPQSWACAETLGAALMQKRELVREMVLETRSQLVRDGWHVGKEKDVNSAKGKSVSIKIRVHKDLRWVTRFCCCLSRNACLCTVAHEEGVHRDTMDFITTVLGPENDRNIDFLTIHPRTRATPSSDPISLEALELLTSTFGDKLPILVSGDVFDLNALPFGSTFTDPPDPSYPFVPKLAGLMSARGLLANPALFAGHKTCPWVAVDTFLRKVTRAPLPFRLVQHHLSEMCGPGMGPDKRALLSKQERVAMLECANMCDLVDFLDEKSIEKRGGDGLQRM